MSGGGTADISAGRCCPSASDAPEFKINCALWRLGQNLEFFYFFFPLVCAESREVFRNTSLGRQVASSSRCLSHLGRIWVGAEFQQAGAAQPWLSSLRWYQCTAKPCLWAGFKGVGLVLWMDQQSPLWLLIPLASGLPCKRDLRMGREEMSFPWKQLINFFFFLKASLLSPREVSGQD